MNLCLRYASRAWRGEDVCGDAMQAEEVKTLLENQIEQATAEVLIEGSHVHLKVVSPAFAGLSAVKRQQMVYAVLAEPIASGVIHAVHMTTLTPDASEL